MGHRGACRNQARPPRFERGTHGLEGRDGTRVIARESAAVSRGCPEHATPARTLHALSGSPALDGCAPLETPEPCWLCGRLAVRGELVSRWMGASYTDQSRARCSASRWICEACVWCCAWSQPPGFPQPVEGRGLNLRLFSHLYAGGFYLAANKADKAWIRAWLAAPKPAPWFCAIADTGQKHVLPWTPINLTPGVVGVVRFEERDVRVDERHAVLVMEMSSLLTAGATKEEIESGRYRPETWTRVGAATLRDREARQIGPARGGGGFALALWLAQRDEDVVAERREREQRDKRERAERGRVERAPVVGSDASARRRVRAGGAPGVPRGRSVGADALDADRAAATSVGPDVRDGSRVDRGRGEEAPARGREQLALFGDG